MRIAMVPRRQRRQRPLTLMARVMILLAVAMLPFLPLLVPQQIRRAGAPASTRAVASLAEAPPVAHLSTPAVHTVTYDRYSLLVDGRRVVLFGGEYQFWRTPSPQRWPVVLREMRAAGLNTVSIGVSWQYHSPAPGVFDFAGARDLGRFLDDAAAAGLYVIARPGPAYDAESNASNLPGWLLGQGGNLRANSGRGYCGAGAPSPAYAAAYSDWFRHVLPIIAAHQETTGGGSVVALQIENEYAPTCGTAQYMSALHDLARQNGIDVPLLANNNDCCVAAGAWHATGDDGQPIVDIPAADDYPCFDLCPRGWTSRVFGAVDTLEARLRAAGVATAPIAVAELQGGYFSGWGQSDYDGVRRALGPSFAEVIDGSVLGQGATIVSVYMVAGGTSWGYHAAPNTATSYDYAAPIHEWGTPSSGYGALKRTGMFVDAFGDLLAATRSEGTNGAVTATNPSLLYAVRQAVDGPQRGARLLVLRNTDPTHPAATALRLPIGGHMVTAPMAAAVSGTGAGTTAASGIILPPHALDLLVTNYHLGPFDLLYSTSRPLTHARVGGDQIAVFYGTPGTPGQTVLSFSHAPTLLRVDPGVTASYDTTLHALRLDYIHQEAPRYVALSDGGRRLVLVLTGPNGAARTWRPDTSGGPAIVMGPDMVTTAATNGRARSLLVEIHGATPITAWTPDGNRRVSASGSEEPAIAARVGTAQRLAGLVVAQATEVRYWSALHCVTARLGTAPAALRLPDLTTWRFQAESPEIAPGFDDHGWTAATEHATGNPNVPPGDTLLADDYGFHYGFVWYRGRFSGVAGLTGLSLMARHSYSVWLNGVYLGSSTTRNDLKNPADQLAVGNAPPSNATYADALTFAIPPGLVRAGATNMISVLVESLGHNVGFENGQLSRSPTGILSAGLLGASGRGGTTPSIAWRLQGAAPRPNDSGHGGHGDPPDSGGLLDAPFNASGLFGERAGWYRPDLDDRAWRTVTVPDTWTARGLRLQGIGWYRTTFNLDLPAGADAPIGLYIPQAQDKVAIWLNGLLIGRYWQGVGPQHLFYLPAGLLREHGRNTLALAVWNRGHDGGLTGGLSLQPYDIAAITTLRAY